MDGFASILILFLVFGGWRLVIWLLQVGGGAAIDTARGKGNFKENLDLHRNGMPGFETEVTDDTLGDSDLAAWVVKIRGRFPLGYSCDLTVVTSVIDVTDPDNAMPVMAALEEFQESETRAFQFARSIGLCAPNQGFTRWVDIGYIPKELLIFPYSGKRKLSVVVRLMDSGSLDEINLGFADSQQPGVISVCIENIETYAESGAFERTEEEMGVAASSIRLALAVAWSDGRFDPQEGKVIKQWAEKFVEDVPDASQRDQARGFVNDAIRYGNKDAQAGSLSISAQVEIISSSASKADKYAALELCLDVMAADGEASQEELVMLNKLSSALEIDVDRFNQLRDHRMINIDAKATESAGVWDTLGIDASYSPDEKRKELKKLYRKWNSRAESLEEGSERTRAQDMIELIAQARAEVDAA